MRISKISLCRAFPLEILPEQGAGGHHGLHDEHVAVIDMAQQPVYELAIVSLSVHAEDLVE